MLRDRELCELGQLALALGLNVRCLFRCGNFLNSSASRVFNTLFG